MKSKQTFQGFHNEKGMALVVTLLLVALLILLGTLGIRSVATDMQISSNYRNGSQAFYIAEAGAEAARNQLMEDVKGGSTLTTLLTNRLGHSGVLSDASNIANLYASGSFVTDNIPYIASTSFGGGTYTVYLTNDPQDTGGVTSTTDTNNQVMVTSFGFGPNNNSFAWVQMIVGKIVPSLLPGAIVVPGPDVNFQGNNSAASAVEGFADPAVTTTSANAVTDVVNGIPKPSDYTCNAYSSPCVINAAATINSIWNSVSGLEGLYQSFLSVANTVVTGTTTLTSAQVGTTSSPQIVIVNGDATLGPVNGAGILVVTGQLTLNGNFNYKGFIMCIGQGNLLRNGGGNGTIDGSILVATTRDTSNNLLTSLGTPTFNTNGGGNSTIAYDSTALNNLSQINYFVRKTWRQSGS